MNESNVIIELNDVTIRYNIASEKIYDLKEYAIKMLTGKLHFKEFFALNDVSFQIHQGESWGIIGKNGAGKSTLLKTICGIIDPYRGSVKAEGYIAPMIELSAGMDSNLTAAENIFLNGAILGNSRKFMKTHFDEIVDFAEIHKFLETPIKNYSSGMRARLGFAVATIVKPDILIVDEVLAVGDFEFRKKCENRIQELLEGGTTLLLVSHAVNDIKKLCDNAIWIEDGKVRMIGDSKTVCDSYMESGKI